MLDFKNRDGLARIVKWQRTGAAGETPIGITAPEILFIETPRIPVPTEAHIIITADPSISEGPMIYHRGNILSGSHSPLEEPSASLPSQGSIIAEIPPNQWYPLGLEKHLKALGFNDFKFDTADDKSKELEKGEGNNIRVIYDSTPEGDLTTYRSDPNIELVILGSALELFDNPRRFVEHIVKIKQTLGQQHLIYAPTLGEPSHIALLAYLGVDLTDTLPLIHNAREGQLLTSTTRISTGEIKSQWFCACRFCKEWQSEGSEKAEFSYILGHNYLTALHELSVVHHAIRTGTLRELVETRIAVEPRAVNILRFIDKLHYDFVEEYIPIARKTKLIASTADSQTRPEVIRFQKRLRERYIKPEYGKVLLLLPCSARKPYSSSRTHQAFMLALKKCKNPMVVHEVIVTSPLGIVPRELELAYPAQHYDIPVTGTWYEEEKSVIRSQLHWLLSNFQYQRIIAHVDKNLYFITEGLEHVEITGGDNPTSKIALDKLTETLNDSIVQCPEISPQERKHQMLTTLLMFHFGEKAGRSLTEGVEFKGNYPYLKMLHKGKQLGMIEGSTGLISLTLAGGERLLESGVYWVEIDDFEMKGDVFAPAVRDADPDIRPFDEVVVYTKKNGDKILKAVGRAAMSGNEMVEAEKGRAVKVRHYVKG